MRNRSARQWVGLFSSSGSAAAAKQPPPPFTEPRFICMQSSQRPPDPVARGGAQLALTTGALAATTDPDVVPGRWVRWVGSQWSSRLAHTASSGGGNSTQAA